jgi:uncharacterized protein (DUF58 family)
MFKRQYKVDAMETQAKRKLTDLLDAQFMARLDGLDLASRRMLVGRSQGQRLSKRRGQSVEFADHRQYSAGDDLRFLDWNIYARLEQLFLKLFLEEQDLTLHILMDVSESVTMGEPSKDLFIRRMAAALGYLGLVHNNRVNLRAFADGVVSRLDNQRGRGCVSSLAEFLLTVDCQGHGAFDKTCKQVVGDRIGSGVVVVLSDMLFKEGYEEGLKRLFSRHYDVYVIQVLSPQERHPTLSGDLKLVDIEDGDMAEITINAALLKYYQRTLSAYCNDIRQFCLRHGAGYILSGSDASPERLTLDTLRRTGMLK